MRTLTWVLAVMIGLLLAALLAAPAPASGGYDWDIGCYADGYTTPAGFVYHASDGYWWWDGCAYRRYRTVTRYWVNGYGCYPGYWADRWDWTYCKVDLPVVAVASVVPVTPAYVPPVLPTSADPNWRARLLDGVLYRDRVRAEIEKGAHEHNQYLEALTASGLANTGFGPIPAARYANGGFLFPGVAAGYGTAYGQGTAATGTYGASGQTLYGYGAQTTQQLYGAADANLLYQAASQHTAAAQESGGKAETAFKSLVAQDADAKRSLAEIEGKARALQALIASAGQAIQPQAQSRTEQKTYAFGTAPAPAALPAPPPAPLMPRAVDAPEPPAVAPLWGGRCAACHGEARPAAGLNLGKWLAADRATKARWYQERLETPDPTKLMPRGGDGKGHALPRDEKDVFMRDVLSTQR